MAGYKWSNQTDDGYKGGVVKGEVVEVVAKSKGRRRDQRAG